MRNKRITKVKQMVCVAATTTAEVYEAAQNLLDYLDDIGLNRMVHNELVERVDVLACACADDVRAD